MAQPVQLRYTDSSDTEQVIGTYLTDDNLIQQAQLKNSGSGEYTRMEIIGDKQLKDNLPIDYTSYGTSEPEIRVYVRDSGSWSLRDRVFPEDAGTIDDQGNFRTDNLWGFQKWVGRQKTPSTVSLTNATITEIIKELLPSGYTAVTPGTDTVPTVENYSFTGKRGKAFRDIVRDYPVKIWFTAETDADDNYIVKVQSKGFGGVVQSVTFDDERQTSGYQIIEFQETDKSNVINKVEVENVNSNGTKITSVKDDSTSISENGERYIYRSPSYIETQAQADNLANNILSPNASPHARMSVGFINKNALNSSIDVTDDRFGIDAVYTIVKQRDFFTEGKTEVELAFEKNQAETRRDSDRDLDEKNHQLFPTVTENVGNQNVNADTEDVTDSYDGHNSSNHPHDVGGKQSETAGGASVISSTEAAGSEVLIFGGNATNFQTLISNLSGGNSLSAGATVYYTLRLTLDNSPSSFAGEEGLHRVKVTDGSNDIPNSNGRRHFTFHDPVDSNGDGSADFYTSDTITGSIHIPRNTLNQDYDLEFGTEEDVNVKSFAKIAVIDEHSHSVKAENNRAQDNSDGSTNATNPSDLSAGDTTNLNASGSTDSQNLDVAVEDKTDRG